MSTVPFMDPLFELTPENSTEEERLKFLLDFLSTDERIKDSLDDDLFDFEDNEDYTSCEDDITLEDEENDEYEYLYGRSFYQATFEPRKRQIEGLTMENAEFADRTFGNFYLENVTFNNVSFKNCTFDRIYCEIAKFIHCEFEDCNINYFSGEGYGFIDCIFTRCHWLSSNCIDDCYFYRKCEYNDCQVDFDED
ncbi:hypothetical protein SAMN02910353_01627 [Ruminococcus sp. YRD2003]|uniref:hypothetical protein n=1 Tax=Ruminococcus sp. YRD2003 TaxID=1452313 RepID=UPI0008BB716F|nr:hypothetical protein SAMN02910353_01627 [Ruminococcus flavefaciens]